MTPGQVRRLAALLAYLDQWEAAHTRWLAWIDREYARRMAEYKHFRAQAHEQLIKSADGLKFKDGRIDNWSAAGARAKRKFRRDCSRIFAAVVLKGQSQFGVEGKRDAAGVFIGTVDKRMGKLAAAALREAFRGR